MVAQKMESLTYMPSSRKEAKRIGSKYYYTGRMCKNMHFDIRLASTFKCRSCNRQWARVKLATDLEYKISQRELCRTRNRNRYRNDPDYRQKQIDYRPIQYAKNRERYKSDPEYRAKKKLGWKKTKQQPSVKEKARISQRERRRRKVAERDPEFIVQEMWRTLLKRCVRAGYKKNHSTQEELGYSPQVLMDHLEKLFEDGMSWENYGRGGWSIDHIRPISSFPLDAKASDVNALSNLQPMWLTENISKGAKW